MYRIITEGTKMYAVKIDLRNEYTIQDIIILVEDGEPVTLVNDVKEYAEIYNLDIEVKK